MIQDFLVSALVTLFVTIDPPGLAPIFVALTSGIEAEERRRIAVRAVLIAAGILAASALVGDAVLGALGIGLPAFRIAGGLLLFWIAAEMVFERRVERKSTTAQTAVERDRAQDIAAFPLAIPLMAGPGAITATILLAGRAEGDLLMSLMLLAVVALVLAACLAAFLLAGPIDRALGLTGRTVLERLLGVLLAALAVQFVADGVMELGAGGEHAPA